MRKIGEVTPAMVIEGKTPLGKMAVSRAHYTTRWYRRPDTKEGYYFIGISKHNSLTQGWAASTTELENCIACGTLDILDGILE